MKNKVYTKEEKIRIIKDCTEIVRRGGTYKEGCDKHGISYTAINLWKDQLTRPDNAPPIRVLSRRKRKSDNALGI